MRPTMLGFRSPKERTPDPYDSKVTFDGRPLSYMQSRTASVKASLPRSKRFPNYEIDARRTAVIVGPGTYDITASSIGKARIRGGPAYKPYHIGKRVENNGYFMLGDQLVFDAHYMSASYRASIKDLYCKVDQTSVLRSSDSFKKRQSTPERSSRPQTSQGIRANRSFISGDDREFDRSLTKLLDEALTPDEKPKRAETRGGGSFRQEKSPYLSKFKR